MVRVPTASSFLKQMLLLYGPVASTRPKSLDKLMVQSSPSTVQILQIFPQLGVRQTLLCGTCAFGLFPTGSEQAWSALLRSVQGDKDLGDEAVAQQLPFLQASLKRPVQPKWVQRSMSMQPS
jgi:hypothetical protein